MLQVAMPLLIVFERHWDESPKQIVKSLISSPIGADYDVLCVEAPEDLAEEEIFNSHRLGLQEDFNIEIRAKQYLQKAGVHNIKLCDLAFTTLANLMQNYVSSKEYIRVAEKIKALPASILLGRVLEDAKRFSLNVRGVDIGSTDYYDMMSNDLSGRMGVIERNEDYRITTFVNNLFELYEQGKGVIFVCGALHAENLISKFRERNMEDRVLYYFPHSNKNFVDNDIDEMENFSNETLKNHMFCLINEKDQNVLVDRIIKEIKLKNTQYKKEVIGGNSHTIFLSDFFQKDFRAFMRPGYYVDALLDVDQISDTEKVVDRLHKVNIPTHKISWLHKNYLVIQDVNTREVGSRIRQLRS